MKKDAGTEKEGQHSHVPTEAVTGVEGNYAETRTP